MLMIVTTLCLLVLDLDICWRRAGEGVLRRGRGREELVSGGCNLLRCGSKVCDAGHAVIFSWKAAARRKGGTAGAQGGESRSAVSPRPGVPDKLPHFVQR